jgi:hypothetical protein
MTQAVFVVYVVGILRGVGVVGRRRRLGIVGSIDRVVGIAQFKFGIRIVAFGGV